MVIPIKRSVEKRKAKALKTQPQVRQSFPDEVTLRALARSVMKRQLHPLILLPGDFILDGECRWRGMMLENPEFEFDVICVERELTAAEIGELQLISAMHSTSLTPFDQAVACREWLAHNPTSTAKDLAGKIDLDPSTVSRLTALWKTIPAVIEAAEQGKLGPKAWYQISLLPESDQRGLLEMHLSGLPASQIEAIRKKKQVPKQESVKVERVKLAFAGGSITVAAPDLDLEGLIEKLATVLDQARKANKDRLDIKTFARVQADKAGAKP